jgi:bacteriorhodopsin
MEEPSGRAASARRAYHGARWWATWVMGLAFPLVLVELCWIPLTNGRGSVLLGMLGVLGSVLFCGGCWAIWVGAASLVGWCRGAEPFAEPSNSRYDDAPGANS